MNELALHRRIVGLLKAYGARRMVWWHTPNGELRDRRVAAKLHGMGLRRGVPDLVLVIAGKACGIEIKTETGRLSKDQDRFIADAADAGMDVHVVRSLDEAITTLNFLGAFRTRLTLADARDVAESAGEGISVPSPTLSPRRTGVPA